MLKSTLFDRSLGNVTSGLPNPINQVKKGSKKFFLLKKFFFLSSLNACMEAGKLMRIIALNNNFIFINSHTHKPVDSRFISSINNREKIFIYFSANFYPKKIYFFSISFATTKKEKSSYQHT